MRETQYFKPERAKERKIPSAREIRRSCKKELYRTVKRLKQYIPPEKIQAAEQLYFKKVILKLQWIVDNGSNRKLLADWWAEEVAPELSALWEVELEKLEHAFRRSFGG